MANRASKVAGPVIRKLFAGKRIEEVSFVAASAAVRAALEKHRYHDGREVHPCVIQDWANEPYRRVQMAVSRNRRSLAKGGGGMALARAERRQRQINLAKNRAQRLARKINRFYEKVGTIAQRIFRRHVRRAHDRHK